MTQPPKKYVFDQLVKNKDDVIQLLAYSLYCSDKNKKANELHAAGKAQNEIEQQLQAHHDFIAGNTQLLQLLVLQAENMHAKYTKTIGEKWKNKIITEFSSRVIAAPENNGSWYKYVGNKLLEGFAGIFATIAVIVISVGIASLALEKGKRDAMLDAGVSTAKETLNGEIPIVDKYRENIKSGKYKDQITSK